MHILDSILINEGHDTSQRYQRVHSNANIQKISYACGTFIQYIQLWIADKHPRHKTRLSIQAIIYIFVLYLFAAFLQYMPSEKKK